MMKHVEITMGLSVDKRKNKTSAPWKNSCKNNDFGHCLKNEGWRTQCSDLAPTGTTGNTYATQCPYMRILMEASGFSDLLNDIYTASKQ